MWEDYIILKHWRRLECIVYPSPESQNSGIYFDEFFKLFKAQIWIFSLPDIVVPTVWAGGDADMNEGRGIPAETSSN